MPSKILVISNLYPSETTPSYGIFVKNIVDGLVFSGMDIEVIAIRGRKSSVLIKLLAYIKFYLHSFIKLCFTDRIVYMHFVSHCAVPFLLANIFRNLVLVTHVHGGDVLEAEHEIAWWERVKNWCANRVMKQANINIVPSDYFRDFLFSQYSINKRNIVVSPSGGVNLEVFRPSVAPRFDTKNVLTLGYVGRFSEGKGIDTLLRACSMMPEQFEFNLICAGNGDIYQEMVQLAENLGLTSRCRFLDKCSQDELPPIFTSLDYLIFPTELEESLGLVGLEAMACGLPIITTGKAGIQQYFVENLNGLQFREKDPIDLARVIQGAPKVNSNKYFEMQKQGLLTAKKFDRVKIDIELASLFGSI